MRFTDTLNSPSNFQDENDIIKKFKLSYFYEMTQNENSLCKIVQA